MTESFDRLPSDHTDMIRSVSMGGAMLEPGDAAYHQGHDIWLSTSPGMLGQDRRNPGCTSELAGHDEPVTVLGTTIPHEVGHDVMEENPEIAEAIAAATGWNEDPDSKYEDAFVPRLSTTCGGDEQSTARYSYALTDRHEYVAELYNLGANLPEQLHRPASHAHPPPTSSSAVSPWT